MDDASSLNSSRVEYRPIDLALVDANLVCLLGSEDNVFGALKLGALQDSLRRNLPTVGICPVA